MSEPNLDGKILSLISQHPEIESSNISMDTDLRVDLGIDSLVIAEITIEIEDALDIRFPDTAIAEVHSVNDVLTIVKKLLNH